MHRQVETLLSASAIGGLGAWLSASAIFQLQGDRLLRLRRFDFLDLVPQWTFFAPNPGVLDYHLLRRYRLKDGTLTRWKEVRLVEERRITHMVWGPNKRQEKGMIDAVSGLLMLKRFGAPPTVVQSSVPYQTFLNLVRHLPRTDGLEGAKEVQFLISTSDGYEFKEEPVMLFVSSLHEVRA